MDKQNFPDNQQCYLDKQRIHFLARKGVPSEEVNELIKVFGVSAKELAFVLGVSSGSITRYRSKEIVLPPQQGEQLLKYKTLLEFGSDTFGSIERFLRWLNSPNLALDKEKPVEYLVTSEGINLIYDEVGRIAFGVLA
jgi:putative toxin-antitoxin system antitoxin component (TIGR02293 family)